MSDWLALVIGNSRLHWAWFQSKSLHLAWDTPHLLPEAIATLIAHQLNFRHCRGCFLNSLPDAIDALDPHLPLWIASVVPEQMPLWQTYDRTQVITLDQVPLHGLYPTLGIDRALALWGAIQQYGAPALVIDAGTALTFTAADADKRLVGGAILPGLQLQMRSLSQHTAALPFLTAKSVTDLPPRWATSTPDAMQSGILYTVLAGIKDFTMAWLERFPESAIVLTGGDSSLLSRYLQLTSAGQLSRLILEPNLVLLGMRDCSDR